MVAAVGNCNCVRWWGWSRWQLLETQHPSLRAARRPFQQLCFRARRCRRQDNKAVRAPPAGGSLPAMASEWESQSRRCGSRGIVGAWQQSVARVETCPAPASKEAGVTHIVDYFGSAGLGRFQASSGRRHRWANETKRGPWLWKLPQCQRRVQVSRRPLAVFPASCYRPACTTTYTASSHQNHLFCRMPLQHLIRLHPALRECC